MDVTLYSAMCRFADRSCVCCVSSSCFVYEANGNLAANKR